MLPSKLPDDPNDRPIKSDNDIKFEQPNQLNINQPNPLHQLFKSNSLYSKWSIEEEYIFFEGHSLLGNKWTFISELFNTKSPKQMKNHFYSSIVKTLRKVLKNKFDSDLKEIIITYYSLLYLKQLFSNPHFTYMLKNSSKKKNLFSKNVTLKKFIINHNINKEKIITIFDNFEKMASDKIRKSYKFIPKFSEKNIKSVFNAIVKIKLLNRCIDIVKLNNNEANNNSESNININNSNNNIIINNSEHNDACTLQKFISQMLSLNSNE